MSDVTPQIHALYYVWNACWDQCPYPPRPHSCLAVRSVLVVRVTRKRIYFKSFMRGDVDRVLFVDRAKLELEGRVWHSRLGTALHLEPPELARPAQPKSLTELRREMVDAHPDRGGTDEGFRGARERYVTAKAGGAR